MSVGVLWRPQAGCTMLGDGGLMVGNTGGSVSQLTAFSLGVAAAQDRKAQASTGGVRKSGSRGHEFRSWTSK